MVLELHLQELGQPGAQGWKEKEENGKKGREGKHSKFNPPAVSSSFPSYGPPIVVHCSAGISRSGTFCMLDYCIDELHAQRKVTVQGAVRRLRMQRAYAIQIDDQYAFCYKTMLEYIAMLGHLTSIVTGELETQRCISGEFVIMHYLCTHYLYGVFF